MSELDLDVNATYIKLYSKSKYKLEITLPFEVHDEKGSAKFDKTKKELNLVLPAVQPPPPERPIVVADPEEVEIIFLNSINSIAGGEGGSY